MTSHPDAGDDDAARPFAVGAPRGDVFIVFPKAHASLAAAAAQALRPRGLTPRPGPDVTAWPLERWAHDPAGELQPKDAAARGAAAAVIVIWSAEPALDAPLRFEADRALSRRALASVLAPSGSIDRLPTRLTAKLTPGGAPISALADAAQAAIDATRFDADQKPDPETEIQQIEERVRRYADLGLSDEAAAAQENSIAARRALLAAATEPDQRRRLSRRLASALIDLAERWRSLEREDAARAAAEEAAAVLRSARDGRGLAIELSLARALSHQAASAESLQRRGEAVSAVSEAIAIYEDLKGRHARLVRPRLGMLLLRLSDMELEAGRARAAEKSAFQAVAHFRALARSGDAADLENLAAALQGLCQAHRARGRAGAAVAAAEEAVEIYRETDADADDLALALVAWSRSLREHGRREDAAAAVAEAITLSRTRRPEAPDAFGPILAEALVEAARQLGRDARPREAAELGLEGLSALSDAEQADAQTLQSPSAKKRAAFLREHLARVADAPRRSRRRRLAAQTVVIALGAAAGAAAGAALFGGTGQEALAFAARLPELIARAAALLLP